MELIDPAIDQSLLELPPSYSFARIMMMEFTTISDACKCYRGGRALRRTRVYYVFLFIAGVSRVVNCANLSHINPFATIARFAVDSEADPSSAPPGQLHPRLSFHSVAASVEPDKFAPKYSLIEIVLYPFPFTPKDVATARKGEKGPLLRKSDALHNSNPKVSGDVAIVQLTLNEHFQIQQVTITVTGVQGYSITLSDRQFQSFNQEYQFDGKKLRFESKGSYRLGGMPAGVAAFTMNWDLNLVIPVFKKTSTAK